MSPFDETVWALAAKGRDASAIAAELGCERTTVTKRLLVLREEGALPGPLVPGFALRATTRTEASNRLRMEAIIRRAFALAHGGMRVEAARLLGRAADLVGEPYRTNFLALGDLIAGSPAGEPLGYRNLSAIERHDLAIAYGHLPG